jgi:hypothetical protein
VTVVSKERLRALATVLSELELPPPSTRQDATPVAPFQLAYTVVRPPVVEAATAGLVAGIPLHPMRYAR